VRTGIPLKYWGKLFFSGVYIKPGLLLLLIIVLAGAGATVIHLSRKRQQEEYEQQVRQSMPQEEEERERPEIPLFSHAAAHGLNPKLHEYLGYLKQFGLNRDADLKSIKAAYRNAVKEVHPDLKHNQSQSDSERFIQLTSAYERLLELRKEMGFPD